MRIGTGASLCRFFVFFGTVFVWMMRQFSDWFGIPYRTVQNWASGARECPTYVRELMMYKLIAEKIIEESEKV